MDHLRKNLHHHLKEGIISKFSSLIISQKSKARLAGLKVASANLVEPRSCYIAVQSASAITRAYVSVFVLIYVFTSVVASVSPEPVFCVYICICIMPQSCYIAVQQPAPEPVYDTRWTAGTRFCIP